MKRFVFVVKQGNFFREIVVRYYPLIFFFEKIIHFSSQWRTIGFKIESIQEGRSKKKKCGCALLKSYGVVAFTANVLFCFGTTWAHKTVLDKRNIVAQKVKFSTTKNSVF